HLAEVFLSGLLRQVTTDQQNPDQIQYDFVDGVRELLLNTITREKTVQVFVRVSEYIQRETGTSFGFSALLADPTGAGTLNITSGSRRFARVLAATLRRLGGEHVQLAERLEQQLRIPHEQREGIVLGGEQEAIAEAAGVTVTDQGTTHAGTAFLNTSIEHAAEVVTESGVVKDQVKSDSEDTAFPPIPMKMPTVLEDAPLESLCATCIQQLQRFQQDGVWDISSCDTILRQAAAHDEEAIAMLIQISELLVRRYFPLRTPDLIDDWTQDVLLHITAKMRNRTNPYAIKPPPPSPFVAYQAYLKIAGRNIAYDQLRSEQSQPNVSIDEVTGDVHEISDPHDDIGDLHRLLRFDRLLQLINEPLDREIFRLRFVLQVSVEETIEILTRKGQVLAKSYIYRSVERTIHTLSMIPEVRELFEE
ncbi:hypothetical protein K2Z83_28450, partial [Oscillochloris sp. ZM17-4]